MKRGILVVLGAAMIALTACSSTPAPQPEPSTAAPSRDSAAEDAAPEPAPTLPAPGPVTLAVRDATIGGKPAKIVTANGWTVYRFEFDYDNPSRSVCDHDCPGVWPPILTDESKVQVDGIDPALVGSIKRADGTTQVTLRGWPLYRFWQDLEQADTKGEGVGNNWSAVLPNGKPVVPKGAVARPSASFVS
ncbi:hypothetical protein ACGFIY_33630 [Micromonospora chersina]|uniref:hypothetical protein n=1 Tax=Micromonospora chersina TaxID=47854 RepID=UPI00371B9245